MFKYLKYLVPKPLYIWYKEKRGHYLVIHRQYNRETGKKSSHWFEYLDDDNYICLPPDGKDPNHINTNMEGDTKIKSFTKPGRTQSRRRDYIKSLPYRTSIALRDRVHGRETIKPE